MTIEFGLTCEPTAGPSTTEWTGKPMDTMSFQDALSVPVPDWRSDVTGPINPC